MKKSFLMLGLAVAAMTSCTNDEVLEQNQSTQKAIGFETFVNKGTRTISETTNPALDGENVTGLKKFYVYGYHENVTDFNGAIVSGTYDANSTDNPKIKWIHTGETRYWANGTYFFAAYANGNNADALANVNFTNKTLTIPYSVSYTTAASTTTTTDAPDLVAAIKEEAGRLQRSEKVSFSFKHLLTKIKFHIVNTNNQGLSVDITDVTISNVKSNGTFTSTYSAANWSPAQTDWSTSGDAVANFIPIAAQSLQASNPNATTDEVTSAEFYVIPQALTTDNDGIKVAFTANYKQGTSIVSTQNVDLYLNKGGHTSWTPGYSYVYTIGLPQSATPIVFGTPSVTTWADGGTITLQ